MNENKEITYSVIVAAKNGDPDAINAILTHYSGLIEFNSRRTMFDEAGTPHMVIDPEIKQRIQAKIIDRVIYDFDPDHLPDGEKLEE